MTKRKLLLFLGLVISLPLFAASMSDRVEQLEKEMQSVYTDTANDTAGAKFVSAGPSSRYDTTWFLSAELLYWHAKSGGTEYAIRFDSSVLPRSGNVKDCDFEWDLGFRFGVGRFISCERNWDLYLTYTHFDTSDTESTSAPIDATLNNNQGQISGMSWAKFDCEADYDALDLMLGRSFFISSKVSFHPFVGVKSAWIDQKQKFHGTDSINAQQSVFLTAGELHTSIHDTCDFWGIGPKFGTDMNWFTMDGFRLFASVSGALFYSYFDVSNRQRFVLRPNGQPEEVGSIRIHGDMHRFVPQARLNLGLSWGKDMHLKNSDQYIELGMGYEVQYFWRVNQCLTESDANPIPLSSLTSPLRVDFKRISEDLSYYGITFKARLDF